MFHDIEEILWKINLLNSFIEHLLYTGVLSILEIQGELKKILISWVSHLVSLKFFCCKSGIILLCCWRDEVGLCQIPCDFSHFMPPMVHNSV